MLVDLEKLEALDKQGFIRTARHNEFPLKIYKYTEKCVFERAWDDLTLMCRGLIVNENTGEVVARPFQKFFNKEEHEGADSKLPQINWNQGFRVFEKMDGSLAILYFWDGNPYIATVGSFHSDQANDANKILNDNYGYTFCDLDKSKTYLFEYLAPENRIVVDYNGIKDLVLIGIRDIKSGEDFYPLPKIGFPVVPEYDEKYLQKGGWILQKGASQNDKGEYICSSEQGVENLQGMQGKRTKERQGEVQGEEAGECKSVEKEKCEAIQGIGEDRVSENQSLHRQSKSGDTVCRLSKEIPAMCDGLRSCERGKEVECGSLSQYGKDKGRNKEMRSEVLELSQDKNLDEKNREGFVIYFQDGLRVKIKFEEYKRLHAIVTGVSAKQIWESLKRGEALEDYLQNVPDEFYKWVTDTIKNLEKQYEDIEEMAKETFANMQDQVRKVSKDNRRKEFAALVNTYSSDFSGVLFKMYDDADYSEQIWKKIKPVGQVSPFRQSDE